MRTAELLVTISLVLHFAQLGSAGRANLDACAGSGKMQQLLANGFFSSTAVDSPENLLIAAALSHEIYAYAWNTFSMYDAMDGLTMEQEQQLAAMYKARYLALGALDAQIISATSLTFGYSFRGGIITTPSDVLVVFEGASQLIQLTSTFKSWSPMSFKLLGHTTSVWQAYLPGLLAVKPQLDLAVSQALQHTKDPAAAKVFLMGHSTGAARAAIYALMLLDQPEPPSIGAVYSFGSAMIGQNCAEQHKAGGGGAAASRAARQQPAAGDTACFVQLYDSKLGDRTFRWVNELDIAVTLPWPAGTLDGSEVAAADADGQAAYRWGHVPNNRVYRSIQGLARGPLYGEATRNCSPDLLAETKAQPKGRTGVTNGTATAGDASAMSSGAGGCDFSLRDHLSGAYLLALRDACVKHIHSALKSELNFRCTTEALIAKTLVKQSLPKLL